MHLKSIFRAAPRRALLAGMIALTVTALVHAADTCRQVVLDGDVSAGHEWKAPIGEGWVFRAVPIPPMQAGYTGWDLVVDREQPAGFPDALYLATPPYRSINEREIGTTYSLRAQDAFGWNPRSFRFLIDPRTFREAQQIYLSRLNGNQAPASRDDPAMARLLDLQAQAAQGELHILDAHLIPGVADPAPFAQRWAMAAARMQHEVEPSATGVPAARGALLWMRFTVTLRLPSGWKLPPNVHASPAPCGQ
jgi:hypothetical protein